jgi:hypothetical protein
MTSPDEFFAVIQGEVWTIKFTVRKQMPRAIWGDCDCERKVIRVRKDLSPLNFTDTLIHEIRHAQHPVLFEAEEFVSTTSSEIAEILLASDRYLVFPKGKPKYPKKRKSRG